MPVRREAPQHPAPAHHSPVNQSHFSGQSRRSAHSSRQHSRQNSGDVIPPPPPANNDWPPLNLADLPPLPPGLALEHLAQFGSAGLEMAIRMGMGIGMGLGQQAQMAQQTQSSGWSNSQSTTSANPTPPSTQATVSTDVKRKSATPQSSNLVSDILNDDFLTSRCPSSIPIASPPSGYATGGTGGAASSASFPASRRPSHGDIHKPDLTELASPEDAAKKDPLATQVWKAYARAKETLPNGHRMENLTWRLMHLTLKKKEEKAAADAAKEDEKDDERVTEDDEVGEIGLSSISETGVQSSGRSGEVEQRGRRKGKSRVVGFQKNDSPAPE